MKHLDDISKMSSEDSSTLRWSYDNKGVESTQKDWNETLVTQVMIAVRELQSRGDGDSKVCLLVSVEVAAIFDDLAMFFITEDAVSGLGTHKLGELGDIPIYRNPYLPIGMIIVCYEDDLTGDDLPESSDSIVVIVDDLPTYE